MLRTYNTLIIACNMCNQPREAMAVHRRMLDEGYTPNATTYNALISAYGKAGQLDKVMEVHLATWLATAYVQRDSMGQHLAMLLSVKDVLGILRGHPLWYPSLWCHLQMLDKDQGPQLDVWPYEQLSSLQWAAVGYLY